MAANRRLLRSAVPADPFWLRQVHGVAVVDGRGGENHPQADASVTGLVGQVCAVMTADCLPILLCDQAGSVVSAVHAGWRGLAAGVIENAVGAMHRPGDQLLAWLGPAIGRQAFEVGGEVRTAFVGSDPAAASAFDERPGGKWLADLYALARRRLAMVGVDAVFGGDFCTFTDAERFFSYRRDGMTGRMASLIWIEGV